jgi:hypothetical protein
MSKLSADVAGRRMQMPGAAGAAFTHYEMMIPLERTRQQFQASAALLQMDDGRVAPCSFAPYRVAGDVWNWWGGNDKVAHLTGLSR